MIFFIIFCKFFCARTFHSTMLYKIVLIFFNYYFLCLKGEEKKLIFFSSQNILDEFFCVLFVFVFLRFFLLFLYFFLVATNTQQIKVRVAFFSLHNLVFKKSNQAKNSLNTVVTSKHLMFKKMCKQN